MRAEKVVELFFSEDEYKKINSIEEEFNLFANSLRASAEMNDIDLCTDDAYINLSDELDQEEYTLEELLTAIGERLAVLRYYIEKNKGAE